MKKGAGKKPEPVQRPPEPANAGGMNLTDFVTHFEQVAKRRLDNINQKLSDLEREMTTLEAEMNKTTWS